MYTRPSLFVPLALSSLLSVAVADCNSYGIDFSAGGSYFINNASTADFTAVTQFTGCQNDTADVGLYNLDNGDQWDCSTIPLLPDGTPETSTCGVEKEDLVSGNYALILLSNNGNGDPLANERDFYLSVGAQATVTVTPTLVFNQTVTPTVTSTSTSMVYNTTTISNTHTVTVPAATKYVTVTPKPTYTQKVISLTRTLKTWTRTAIIITKTETATCTVPPRPQQPDPTCTIYPKNMQIPAGINIPSKRDATLNSKFIAKRLEDIRARRAAQQIDERDLAKRSADAPTVTVTETTFTANATSTFTGTTSTVSAVVLSTTTISTTQAPVTVHTGVAKSTVTAPAQTKTNYKVVTDYVWSTRTMTAKYTKIITVTPSASVTACKHQGGHFGQGW